MTDEDLRTSCLGCVRAANVRGFEAIGKLIHDRVTTDGVWHTPEDIVISLKEITDAVPDFTWHIEELFTADDGIAARLRDTGTPAKAWLGLRPRGASVDFTEYASSNVRDGPFAAMRFLMDAPPSPSSWASDTHPAEQAGAPYYRARAARERSRNPHPGA